MNLTSRAILSTLGDLLTARQTLGRHRADPVAYVREVLGIHLWSRQQEVCRALVAPPHRVMVESANGVGKTLLTAALACWFYDCFDPGIGIVTGPKFDKLKDTSFKEIRRFFAGRPGLFPRNPRLEGHPAHYLNGETATDPESFQGIHGENLFLLFEEAIGVAPMIWTAARSCLQGGECTYWVAILNPTDTASHAYRERLSGEWTVISISAFEHPNIIAELEGRDPVIPAAVRLGYLIGNMREWGESWPMEWDADPVRDVDLHDPATYGADSLSDLARDGIDRHFPGRFWRPAPEGEARVCGRYPSQSAYSVFSEAAFAAACRPPAVQESELLIHG